MLDQLDVMTDPETETVIRPATIADGEALADIYRSSAHHHAAIDPELYRVPERGAVVAELLEALRAEEDSSVIRLVAVVAGAVVASARVELRSPTAGSMLRQRAAAWVDVAVLEGHRGGGIGSRLMEAAEDWGRRRGATLMMLDASAANVDALRFYEQRHGFRLRGVLMMKPLDPAGP